MRRNVVLICVLIGSVCALQAFAGGGSVAVAGVQVVASGYGANGSELRPFDSDSGVKLSLVVHPPEGKRIVEIDEDECVLKSLTDSAGTNLLDGVDWGAFPDVAEDGSVALVDVSAGRTPAAGATAIAVAGSVRAQVAGESKIEKVGTLKLEEGAEIETSHGTLTVRSTDTSNGFALVFGASSEIVDALAEARFEDGDGNPVEPWGTGSMSWGDDVQLEYDFPEQPAGLSMELEWWEGMEMLDIPFEANVGLAISG